jgi:hypothetical protein
MPWRGGALEGSLVVPDHVVRLSASDGGTQSFDFLPARPISEVWSTFNRALRDIGVAVDLWDKPQERRDATPLIRRHWEFAAREAVASSSHAA